MMRRATATALFLLLGLVWGGSFVAIEAGLGDIPPVLFAAFRFYIAGLVILGYAVVSTGHWWPRERGEWLVVGVAGTMMIGGAHAFLYLGVPYVSGAVAAIVISLSPILTAVFATVLLDDRLTLLGVVGFGFGLLGIGLISQPDPGNLVAANTIGVGLVFASAVCWSLGTLLTRPLRTELPVQSLQAWAMLIGAPLLHGLAMARGESLAAITWSPTVVWSLAYLGLVSGAAAFLLFFVLLDRLGPAEINLVGYLEPVAATVLSYLVLGRLIGLADLAGFVAIFVGFVLIKRDAIREIVVTVQSGTRSE